MLFDGPPAIAISPQGLIAQPVPLTLPPPFINRAHEIVGFSTRIGIGEVAWMTAQIDFAPVLCFVSPFSMPANQVEMLLVTWTRTRAAAPITGVELEGKFRVVSPTLEADGK